MAFARSCSKSTSRSLHCLKVFFFFNFAVNVDQIGKAEHILSVLKDPLNELYLSFLSFVLPLVNNMNLNRLFQSEKPTIYILYSEMKRLVKTLINCFLNEGDITTFEDLTIDHISILSDDELYLGTKVQEILAKNALDAETKKLFCMHCKSFFIVLIKQINKRFNFEDEILKSCQLIDPKNVMAKGNSSLFPLYYKFNNLVKPDEFQEIDMEWREIKYINFTELFVGQDLLDVDVENFWSVILKT